jgi:hypothetical protein
MKSDKLVSIAISWAEEADFTVVRDTFLRWGWRCKVSLLVTSNGELDDSSELPNVTTALHWCFWMQQ